MHCHCLLLGVSATYIRAYMMIEKYQVSCSMQCLHATTMSIYECSAYIFQLVLAGVHRIRDTYLKLHGCFGQ